LAQLQTIVFDFGNVLGCFNYQRTLARLGSYSELGPAELRAAVYGPQLEAYEAGHLSTAEFLAWARTACRLSCDVALVAAAWSDIFHPNREVCALVPRLRPRYRLLLGSNTNELHARQFRRQFADTLQHFDALVLSHEVGARKPATQFYHHCERLAGCDPEACLFIDDLPANVEAARACGWQGIVFTGIRDLQDQLAAMGVVV
jgi:FMN phosphatase YigB (HAD superfamily)